MKKLLFSLLFLSSVSFAAEDMQYQNIVNFGTLNNYDTSLALNPEKASDLLNVDLTPGGKSVKKRKGYSLTWTLSDSSSPVHGTYQFYDVNGRKVDLYFNGPKISASIGGAAPVILTSTATSGATYQCIDYAGQAYCTNSARDNILQTNGASFSYITPSATGNTIAVTPSRLVLSGSAAYPNRIDFSQAGGFTTWTTGANATDPVQIVVTAPGSRVVHVTYAFNRLMWFKDSSFGYILEGVNQSSWKLATVNPLIGTLDNTSVYKDGVLYFRAQDSHIYAYDGASLVKLSREITNTVNQSQVRQSNSYVITTKQDFDLGTTSNTSTAVINNAVTLSTLAYVYVFDSEKADYDQGTFSNTTSTQSPGYVQLIYGNGSVAQSLYSSDNGADIIVGGFNGSYGAATYRSFTTGATPLYLNGITLRLKRTGTPADFNVTINTNNNSTNRPTSTSIAIAPVYSTNVAVALGDVYVTMPETYLAPNTRYWLFTVKTTTVTNYYEWEYTTGGDPTEFYGYTLSTGLYTVSGGRYEYKLHAKSYNSSGTFLSRALDVGYSTQTWLWNWGSNFQPIGITPIVINSSVPTGTTMTFETQTSSSATGTWSTLASATATSVDIWFTNQSPPASFIRYKATMATTDPFVTPKLDNITLNTTALKRRTGTYQTNAIPVGSAITSWDYFSVSNTLNDGTIEYTFSSSSSSDLSPSSSAVIMNGQLPTVSTNAYASIIATFTITNATQTPTLNDLTVYWYEGNAKDKTYAIYFNDAILWAVTIGNVNTTNNRILKYDLINQGWLIYDIPANGFYLDSTNLYFGSPIQGKIFKYGDTNNDNGSSINAYWKSKDFPCDNPFVRKELGTISTIATSIANSTITVNYQVDASTYSHSFTSYDSTKLYYNNNKNIPGGRTGQTYNISIGNNEVDQPFEIFGISIGYRVKPWNAGQ